MENAETVIHSPIPVRAPKKAIAAATAKFVQMNKLEPGFKVEILVKNFGGRIEIGETFGSSRAAESIRVTDHGKFVIFIAADTSPLRDRFTIAHELGHYFLHYPLIVQKYGPSSIMVATRFVDENDKDLVRTEWEANWFAAELLMPEEVFRKIYSDMPDFSSLSSYFNVTNDAAKVRAQSLGLIER